MSVYKILLGANAQSPTFSFQDDAIESINEEKALGVIGDELTIDTIEAVVRYNPTAYHSRIDSIYGTPIYYYHNDVLIDKFYVDTIERTGKNKYTINGISAIGLLENKKHYGGVYFGETFSTVLNSIFNGTLASTEYTVSSEVSSIPVYGRLPYGVARNNLHKLLMAYNVSITKDSNGQMYFGFLNINATATSIISNDIYEDGDAEYGKKPTEIEITEYAYIPWEDGVEEQSLYDTSSDGKYLNNYLVEFGDPIIKSTLRTDSSSLLIISSSSNHAVLTGKGILYGKPYGVKTNVHKYSTGFNGKEYIISLNDNTLVTFQNYYAISERLKDYYSNTTTYSMETTHDISNVGGKYSFTNSFGESTTGLLSKMSKTMSSTIKSECDIVSGLTYYGADRVYSNSVVLTQSSSGTWTIPEGVTHILAILIGGGHGGDSGYDGEDGADASESSPGRGGEGGEGGEPGCGGDINALDLDVTPLSQITYDIGSGGAGGDATLSSVTHEDNAKGSAGSPTTLTYNYKTYSSELYGSPSSVGYCRCIGNESTDYKIYAKPSLIPGITGGNGGDGGSYYSSLDAEVSDIPDTVYGSSGEDVVGYNGTTYKGGGSATLTPNSVHISNGYQVFDQAYTWYPATVDSDMTYYYHRFHGLGGGGGAAEGENGSKSEGTSIGGYQRINYYGSKYSGSSYCRLVVAESGYGGFGANGLFTGTVSRSYGDGGRGGSGGGGGGGGGCFGPLYISESTSDSSGSGSSAVTYTYYGVTEYVDTNNYIGKGGKGGQAGSGQAGMPGCIVIYY